MFQQNLWQNVATKNYTVEQKLLLVTKISFSLKLKKFVLNRKIELSGLLGKRNGIRYV